MLMLRVHLPPSGRMGGSASCFHGIFIFRHNDVRLREGTWTKACVSDGLTGGTDATHHPPGS